MPALAERTLGPIGAGGLAAEVTAVFFIARDGALAGGMAAAGFVVGHDLSPSERPSRRTLAWGPRQGDLQHAASAVKAAATNRRSHVTAANQMRGWNHLAATGPSKSRERGRKPGQVHLPTAERGRFPQSGADIRATAVDTPLSRSSQGCSIALTTRCQRGSHAASGKRTLTRVLVSGRGSVPLLGRDALVRSSQLERTSQ